MEQKYDEIAVVGLIAVVVVGLAILQPWKGYARTAPGWDVNQDGVCDATDLQMVAYHYGETGEPGWIPEDVNEDGVVNNADTMTVSSHQGESW